MNGIDQKVISPSGSFVAGRARNALLFSAITFLLCSQSTAAVAVIPIKDIGTFKTYTDSNIAQTFSGTGFIGMYPGQFIHILGLELSDFSRTAVQADISAFSGAKINNAILSFNLVQSSPGVQTATVTSFTANGTLNHFWTPPNNLGETTFTAFPASTANNSVNVTSFLQERVDAGSSWLGLHLRGSTLYQWTATLAPDSAQMRLTVDYTPVPEPSIVSMGGVLFFLGCVRYRRRNAVRGAG